MDLLLLLSMLNIRRKIISVLLNFILKSQNIITDNFAKQV